MNKYKRIITISPLPSSLPTLMTWDGEDGISVRKARVGNNPREYVIEGTIAIKRRIDRLADMFDCDD